MVGIFGAVPRLKNTQKTTKKFRLDTWYRFQWSDKDSSLCWFSYLKKSLMSASVRAFRVNDILVMSTAFTLADSSFLAILFRPTGDLLLKVFKPTLGMITAMGLKPFTICIEQIEYSLVNGRGFPQTAISRPMTSPASFVIRSGPVFLKWYSSLFYYTEKSSMVFEELFSVFSLAGEDSGWSMLYYLFEPEMRAFSNSSIAQIPDPKNTLLFLLVLWPHYHTWKLGIMLLLLSRLMMKNTVNIFYSRLIFHKGMGAWMGLQTCHASQGDRHLKGIICVSKG